MNDLLTRSVSKLFVNNVQTHINFFKAPDRPVDLPSGSRASARGSGENALNESQYIG
jgi:hypothetical protein